MRKINQWLTALIAAMSIASLARGGDFAGLTPGRSTLADARAALGESRLFRGALVFPGETFDAREIRVVAAPGGEIIHAITILPARPAPLQRMREWLSLPEPTLVDPAGVARVETYHAALVALRVEGGRVVELTHEAPAVVDDRLRAAAEREQAAGRFDRAVDLYMAILPRLSRDAAMRNALAEALHGAGRDDDAEEVLRETLVMEPSNESAQDLRALVDGARTVGGLPVLGAVTDYLVVEEVAPGSPAAQAGLEPGDELRQVHSFKVRNPEDIQFALLYAPPGSPISVLVYRDGKAVSLNIPFVARDNAGAMLGALGGGSPGEQASVWLDLSGDLAPLNLAKSYGAAARAWRLVAGDPEGGDRAEKAHRMMRLRRLTYETQLRGSRLISAQRWDEALAAVDRMLELEPSLPAALQARAHILYYGKDRSDEALNALASISTWPQSRSASSALILRGDILFDLERFAEAGVCYELAWTGPMPQADLRYLRFALARTAHRLGSPRAAALWREYLAHAEGIDRENHRREIANNALDELAFSPTTAGVNRR